jgi:uncharacterized membrane protein YidH (DUF202 family)
MRRWTDPPEGLASERTALSWQRTGLALAVVAALLLHAAGRGWHMVFAGAAVAYAVAAVLIWRTGSRLYQARSDDRRPHLAPRALRLIAAATVGAALLGVAIELGR